MVLVGKRPGVQLVYLALPAALDNERYFSNSASHEQAKSPFISVYTSDDKLGKPVQ